MQIDRAQISEILRSKGRPDRAEWVNRTLPQIVDTNTNRSLLRMLDIDPTDMTPVDRDAQDSRDEEPAAAHPPP